MTAMSYWSRMPLHSISHSAVLPEPTGPPMPTRSGLEVVFVIGLYRLYNLYYLAELRSVQPAVLHLVLHRQQRQAGRPVAHLLIGHRLRVTRRRLQLGTQRQQQPLSRHLPQRHRFDAHQHLVLGQANSIASSAASCGICSASTAQAKAVGSATSGSRCNSASMAASAMPSSAINLVSEKPIWMVSARNSALSREAMKRSLHSASAASSRAAKACIKRQHTGASHRATTSCRCRSIHTRAVSALCTAPLSSAVSRPCE